ADDRSCFAVRDAQELVAVDAAESDRHGWVPGRGECAPYLLPIVPQRRAAFNSELDGLGIPGTIEGVRPDRPRTPTPGRPRGSLMRYLILRGLVGSLMTLLLLAGLFTGTTGPAHADVVLLKDGHVLQGKVLRESQVILEGGVPYSIPKTFFLVDDQVRRVIFGARQVEDVEAGDTAAEADFAPLR